MLLGGDLGKLKNIVKELLNSTVGTENFVALDKKMQAIVPFVDKENKWTTLKAITSTVGSDCGCVFYKGEIYVFYNLIAQKYNPKTDTWTTLAAIPSTVGITCFPAVCNDEIYVFNGTTAQKYTPSTNAWTTLASLPASAATGVKPVVHNDKIYVTTSAARVLCIYTPATSSWTTTPQSTIAFSYPTQAVVYNDELYFLNASGAQKYNPKTDTWTTLANVSLGGTYWAVLHNNKIYSFSTTGRMYDPLTDTNTTLASPPSDIRTSRPVLLANYIFYFKSTKAYRYNILTDTWTTLVAPTTTVGDGYAVANDKGAIYVLYNATAQKLDVGSIPITLHLNKGSDVYISGAYTKTIETDGVYSYQGFENDVLQIK